ncbi:DNA cytosine methyltransferase [Corynebacterium liangguodongii]|uniref:DNA cytosine methyltransferase n=1 Tax=Corynebacterium liangguodongii TaxID=2079535 RepID=A0A2S0WGC1_9CORY|nr:DNA (cytosine-5-)-methyltransferase [Corynebacterium liangguodongii]AWB84810.1 DNA cytosine methyltransferase [Corynebacterium liangguodongii]PWB99167.1 DNA cytosine methyltransferase [Corynebacterium liangguodongii]
MKIGSLFSGYGGLDLAVEAVTGARPAWFCEWDAAPSKILAHHWPGVPNFRDVTKVNWSQVEPVGIITGGSPCQDLSAAGKRAGMTEGTRSNLWVNMREAIAAIRPRLVVWENVQGALSAKATSDSDMEQDGRPMGDGGGGHLRALGRVLGDLAEIGYDAKWTTIRASDIGAPHHRARVFLIAYPRTPNTSSQRHGSGIHPHDVGRVDNQNETKTRQQQRTRQVTEHRSTTTTADTGRVGLETGRLPGGQEPQHPPH